MVVARRLDRLRGAQLNRVAVGRPAHTTVSRRTDIRKARGTIPDRSQIELHALTLGRRDLAISRSRNLSKLARLDCAFQNSEEQSVRKTVKQGQTDFRGREGARDRGSARPNRFLQAQ